MGSSAHSSQPSNTHPLLTSIYSDYIASLIDGDHMPEAAQTVLNEINTLLSPPTNARKFLIADDYGRGTFAQQGQDYKQQIFDGLISLTQYVIFPVPPFSPPPFLPSVQYK